MTIVLAAGDTGARRDNEDSMFVGCRAALADGDIVFGQLETTVSAGGSRSPNASLAMRAAPTLAPALKRAGFDVMSFAGNHCLDWGYGAFQDTLEHAATAGLKLCGAGSTIAVARQPARLEHDGLAIAFIACSSILPAGYRATRDRPGCMPLRAYTVYEQVEKDQPGTPARTFTYPHSGDLRSLCTAIEEASAAADIVFVSVHWGLHMVEAEIADYQRAVAHAAIDAGAAALFGHHPHILKGVEIYRGAPVFYSLGNFAIEQPHIWDPDITGTDSFRHLASLNDDWDSDRVYMLPEDTRMTGLARLEIDHDGISSIGFVPAWIDDDSVPWIVAADEPRFEDIRAYLEKISASQGFETRFRTAHSRIEITG